MKKRQPHQGTRRAPDASPPLPREEPAVNELQQLALDHLIRDAGTARSDAAAAERAWDWDLADSLNAKATAMEQLAAVRAKSAR